MLAVDVSRLCVTPLTASTPMCAFIPKYQSFPFFVDDIPGSRAPALFLVEDSASMILRRLARAHGVRLLTSTRVANASLTTCRIFRSG